MFWHVSRNSYFLRHRPVHRCHKISTGPVKVPKKIRDQMLKKQHIATSATACISCVLIFHATMVPPPHYQRRRQRSHNPLQTATTVAAAAVAAYGTYRLASWAWDSFWNNNTDEQTEQDDACVENSAGQRHHASQHSTPLRNGTGSSPTTKSAQRRRRHALVRQHRITRCRSETTAALSDFLPTLKQTIESSTDFSSETAELKKIRKARGDRLRRRMEADMTTGGVVAGAETSDGKREETPGKDKKAEEEDHAERRRETELWETIKVRSLSRLLVTAHGHSLLLLVLSVQVHLLGGRLFREEEAEAEAEAEHNNTKSGGEVEITTGAAANNDGFSTTSSLGLHSRTGPKSKSSRSSSMPSYQATHRTVLTQTYGHFFASGLAELMQVVQEAVSQVFEKYDVTDPDTMNLSDEEFNGAIDAVRSIVEESVGVGSALRSALVRYIVQPEDNISTSEDNGTGDAIAAHILEETWDILESPTFAAAERDVLDLTYGMLREGGWGGIFPPTSSMADLKMDVPQSSQASSVHGGSSATSRPLAQIVTQLRRTTNTFYAGVDRGSETYEGQTPNVYLPAVDRLPTLLELGDVGFN